MGRCDSLCCDWINWGWCLAKYHRFRCVNIVVGFASLRLAMLRWVFDQNHRLCGPMRMFCY
nr:hypothetical protein Q903MT_gene2037 [Picea sitchensis]